MAAPRYQRAWLTADVLAGLTLWGLVVPEGMAYTGIANLPPQTGLYTLLAALLVYAVLGLEASHGVEVVGTLPQGLRPSPCRLFPSVPLWRWLIRHFCRLLTPGTQVPRPAGQVR